MARLRNRFVSGLKNNKIAQKGVKAGKVAVGGVGLGNDAVKGAAGFAKERNAKILDSMQRGMGGKTNPKLLNFKQLDKTKSLNGKTKRTTDKYDRKAHNSGLFTERAAGKAASEMRNLGRTGTELKDNLSLAGGWTTVAGHAGVGAIGGGIAGAGVNVLRGEDAWEGAKNGAMMGAVAVSEGRMPEGVDPSMFGK